MAAHAFIGTWEIIGCISHGNHSDANGLEGLVGHGTLVLLPDVSSTTMVHIIKGDVVASRLEGHFARCDIAFDNVYRSCRRNVSVRFRLDESGDVTWYNVSEEVQSLPLFSCETYELFSASVMDINLRFGAYVGHIIEFRSDHIEPRDTVVLTCEVWCSLHCKRVTEDITEAQIESPFSLLPALEDGYFSDLTIPAANNKQFAVHTCILQLLAADLDWTCRPPPFSGLPEPVLGTLLHWLYAECLPSSLTETTARQVISAATPYPCLQPLINMCQLYLKNMALKQQIIGLVSDMHACGAQIIEHFNCRNCQSAADNITSNPAKLCSVIKQSVREAAVAGAKLLLLCDLFTKRKAELSREERHEIIRYAKSRLPIFMNQLQRFLQSVKATFNSMSSSQRQEVATYLVPEIEVILDTVSNLIISIKGALEQIIQVLSPASATSHRGNASAVSEVLGRSLRSVLHVRELAKLRNFHEHITCSLGLLLHKRESFNDMTGAQKVRSVARNLEQLIEELPIFLLRLEEPAALDEKLEWRDFKFCFKVSTSKVSGILHKLRSQKEAFHDVVTRICELVQRDAFSQALAALELLDPAACPAHHTSDHSAPRTDTPKQHGSKLNLVESLCVPPKAGSSILSKKALQLLRSGQGTDMEFEVALVQESNGGGQTTENSTVGGHRVIVAARCDWFRRALLSGMREAIDRKVIIHDTSPFLFRVFLDYLYGGRLSPGSLSTEQLADLMLLSDRYELDALKQACEHGLRLHIDEDSVLYFLSMADQFNAKHLRMACMNFVSAHPAVLDCELFGELPASLQAELYELALWARPPPPLGAAQRTSPTSSIADLEEMAANVHVTHKEGELSNSSSLEELSLTHDSARLESCIAQLKDIVGEGASREQLLQVALAADYDVNRAVNFYFSES